MNLSTVWVTVVLSLLAWIADCLDQNLLQSVDQNCADFTVNSWICDPNRLLSEETTMTVLQQLFKLQTDTPCHCPNPANCYRLTVQNGEGRVASVPIESGFAAALLVTPTLNSNESSVRDTVSTIYHQSSLGRLGCDNGIMLLYAVQPSRLIVYRGNLTYGVLSEAELHQLINNVQMQLKERPLDATVQTAALVRLVDELREELRADSGMQARSWEMVVGMIVACLLALVAFLLLLILCCYAICNRNNKHKQFQNYYYPSLGPGSFYDSIGRGSHEPIYIVSEPSTVYYPLNEPAYASLPRNDNATLDRLSHISEQPLTRSPYATMEREREVQNRHMNLYDQVEM